MTKEFTLKTVVDFLEAHGFYVRAAQEIEEVEEIPAPFSEIRKKGKTKLSPPKRAVEAIKLEIVPKADGKLRWGAMGQKDYLEIANLEVPQL